MLSIVHARRPNPTKSHDQTKKIFEQTLQCENGWHVCGARHCNAMGGYKGAHYNSTTGTPAAAGAGLNTHHCAEGVLEGACGADVPAKDIVEA